MSQAFSNTAFIKNRCEEQYNIIPQKLYNIYNLFKIFVASSSLIKKFVITCTIINPKIILFYLLQFKNHLEAEKRIMYFFITLHNYFIAVHIVLSIMF
ncbi:hypothetical protein V1478_000809 [Vespula squamosa]|uniref:Uncharacterized protein n=1 Tax=Vespula squamosa TaxID=30214 RepID=A0ABD2C6J0_VESSQ